MATFAKRANGWFVQIRRKGYDPEYRTFRTKAEGQKWAREREARIDTGNEPTSRRELKATTLGDLIRRYMAEITPSKASAESERLRLSKLLKAPVCDISLADLTTAPVAAYRDARAKEVKPGTVARELSLLHNIVEVARRDWSIGITSNPVAQVRRLPVKNARDRRLEPGELERLKQALKTTRNKLIEPAILLAIHTGLRRGELLHLTWEDIDLHRRIAHIPHTETGFVRTVPLADASIAIL